ncbi:MAG: hypothetical protein NTU91_04130 [Chloroflexi bacterium]|nr:hypothetical protein [Chloroflexota bacterium]
MFAALEVLLHELGPAAITVVRLRSASPSWRLSSPRAGSSRRHAREIEFLCGDESYEFHLDGAERSIYRLTLRR